MTFPERFADNERTIVYGDDGDDKHSIHFWDDHKPTTVEILFPHDPQKREIYVNGSFVGSNAQYSSDQEALEIMKRVTEQLR